MLETLTLSKKHYVPLESSVTDALEEYVCKLYQSDIDIVRLTKLR